MNLSPLIDSDPDGENAIRGGMINGIVTAPFALCLRNPLHLLVSFWLSVFCPEMQKKLGLKPSSA